MRLVIARMKKVDDGRKWYRGLFQMLRFRFPAGVLDSDRRWKTVVFLERHADVWEAVYRVFGWRVVERWVVECVEFEEMYGDRLPWLLSLVEATYEEYRAAPRALADSRYCVTRFHELLRTSTVYVFSFKASVESVLEMFLERGVVPIDYSDRYVVVARRPLGGGRWWLSALGFDPLHVLRVAAAELGGEYKPASRLVFEDRRIGWGLAPR